MITIDITKAKEVWKNKIRFKVPPKFSIIITPFIITIGKFYQINRKL